jgi:hypothetical protein
MVLGCTVHLETRLFAPHRGIRAVVCVPECSRMRWTSSVTGTCAALVSRHVRHSRACGQAVRCGCSPHARQRRRPVFEAAASRRFPRYERRSPYDLPQPATTGRPEALASGPPAASPYPILRGMSRRLCAPRLCRKFLCADDLGCMPPIGEVIMRLECRTVRPQCGSPLQPLPLPVFS